MVACAPEQLGTLEPGLHLEKKFVCQAVESVKHANWFEIEASDNTVRILVRLVKDITARYECFKALTPWMIGKSHFTKNEIAFFHRYLYFQDKF